jgi:hypothetical protein
MCVVSMIGDHYNDKWKNFDPLKNWPQSPSPQPSTTQTYYPPAVSREEFDKLKAEVEEMKKLLIKAKIYDEQNNEPNCEMEDKIALLKRVAEMVGVSLDDIFKNGNNGK